MRERGSDTWNSMREAFGERFGAVRATMEIASNETIKQAVIAGMGVSFLSSHAIALDVRVGNLVVLPVDGFPSMRQLVRGAPPHEAPAAGGLAFKAFLQAEGAAEIERIMALDAARGMRASRPALRMGRRGAQGCR